MSGEQDSSAPAAPVLRVVRGEPSAEELAALVAVVGAMAAADGEEPRPAAPAQWSAPARLHRGPVSPGGPGSWWSSGLPR